MEKNGSSLIVKNELVCIESCRFCGYSKESAGMWLKKVIEEHSLISLRGWSFH